MATFEFTNERITFNVTMWLIPENQGGQSRTLKVCDDGWKIWLKDEEGNTLYSINFGPNSDRKANREMAMAVLRVHGEWWKTQEELFTRHHLYMTPYEKEMKELRDAHDTSK